MKSRDTSVLFFLSGLDAGGTEKVVTTIARHWAAEGRTIRILVLERTHEDFFGSGSSIPVTSVESYMGRSPIKKIPLLGPLLGVRRALRALEPHTVASFLPGPNVLSILARFGLPIRVVVSERNNIAKRPLPFHWRMLRRLSYRYADRVTYNLHWNHARLETFVPRNKLQYLPNPLWPTSLICSPKTKNKTVLTIGRLHPQKGYDVLLTAFAESEAINRGWNLTIVGNGAQHASLNEQIARLRIADHVRLIQSTTNVWKEFHSSKFFILPSRYEGMPNVLLEALQHGLIPLVSDMVGDLVDPIRAIHPNLIHVSGKQSSMVQQINWATNSSFPEKLAPPDAFEKIISPYQPTNALPVWDQTFF